MQDPAHPAQRTDRMRAPHHDARPRRAGRESKQEHDYAAGTIDSWVGTRPPTRGEAP